MKLASTDRPSLAGFVLILILPTLLTACGGSRSDDEFATFAAATAAAGEPRAHALALSAGTAINRYEFSTGVLSLSGLHVVDGARTSCYDVSLRTASTQPFVLELTAAAEVVCAPVSTAPGEYQAGTGKLTLPGMTAVNGGASSCYDVVLNRVSASPIRLQVASTAAATCAGAAAASSAGVQCSYSYSALNTSALVNLASTANWSCSSSQRSLLANSVPDHDVGPFNIQDAALDFRISAQTTSFSTTMTPAVTSTTGTAVMNSGYALNGLKFDPGTGGTCSSTATSNNTTASGASTVGGCSLLGNVGTWRLEALGQTAFNFGADASNGHVQPTGEYHYHGMPEKFITKLGKGTATMSLVGWASDGFPMYARYGYVRATDSASGVKVMSSSWRKKATPDAGRPSTAVFAIGTFLQDYEYVAGSGDLDQCNGRTGVTPEFPGGTYHYMVTDTWPFVHRCVKGTASGGGPPGGGPPGGPPAGG